MTLYLNWTLGLIAFCGGVIYFGVFQLWMVPYLVTVYGYSRTMATTVVGAGLMSYGLAVVAYGEVARRWKKRKILIYGSALCYLCLVVLVFSPLLPLGVVVVFSAMTGAGCGCFVIVFTLVREYNWYYGSAEAASGLVNMIMVSSGVVSQYTIGKVLDWSYATRTGESPSVGGAEIEYDEADFQKAFLVVPVGIALMVALTFVLKETNGTNLAYDEEEGDDNLLLGSVNTPSYQSTEYNTMQLIHSSPMKYVNVIKSVKSDDDGSASDYKESISQHVQTV